MRRFSIRQSLSGTPGHFDEESQRAVGRRRQSWSGVLGWRNKNARKTEHIPMLSPPTTLCSVATTLNAQDESSHHGSAFHGPPFDAESHGHGARSEGVKPIIALTVGLRSTYTNRNPKFRYDATRNPRRVLTKPSKGCKNNCYDNENSDLILYVNGVLGGADGGNTYIVHEMLGSGTFGQVVKCMDTTTGKMVGIKVIKNKPAYLKQSLVEVDILKHLNQRYDPAGEHHILRLLDVFSHRHHLCLVLELLSVNLYELVKQNRFRGLSINLVRVLTGQIVDVLIVLKEAHIIHCDLKPENILLQSLESPNIKVVDFGSACHQSQRLYTYIQSRFYRSPEILLGLKYTNAIDMWSLGCIAAELFLGLPLFPGSSEYDQLSRIIDSLGLPPAYMAERGRNAKRFFNRVESDGRVHYTFKSRHQYMDDENRDEKPGKKYFATADLEELILTYPLPRKHMSERDKAIEKKKRTLLVDFLKQALQIDPLRRITPQEAKHHPFITGQYVLDESKLPEKEDLSNWCICSVSSGEHSGEQQKEGKPSSKTTPLVPTDIGTPPLSPVEMNIKEPASGISTATNLPQSNRGSRRSSFALAKDEDGLRLRQQST